MKEAWKHGMRFGFLYTAAYFISGMPILALWLDSSESVDHGYIPLYWISFYITLIPVLVSGSLTATGIARLRPALHRVLSWPRAGLAGIAAAFLIWAGPVGLMLEHVKVGLKLPAWLGFLDDVSLFLLLAVLTASAAAMVFAWVLPPWRSRVQSST